MSKLPFLSSIFLERMLDSCLQVRASMLDACLQVHREQNEEDIE